MLLDGPLRSKLQHLVIVQRWSAANCSTAASREIAGEGEWIQGWIQGGFIGMAFLEQQGQGSRGKTLLRLPDLGHVTLVKWIYCMGAHRETL